MQEKGDVREDIFFWDALEKPKRKIKKVRSCSGVLERSIGLIYPLNIVILAEIRKWHGGNFTDYSCNRSVMY